MALSLQGGLAEFAARTGGVPYTGWKAARLTNLPVQPLAVFEAAFNEATANAEHIYFNIRTPFDAGTAISSPDNWLEGDNVTNMEYKAIIYNPVLYAKTSFVP